jgi:hypothetical protein
MKILFPEKEKPPGMVTRFPGGFSTLLKYSSIS